MHPRNPYRHKKPNFKSLAVKYEFFRQFVSTSLSGKCLLDFKQPEALRALLKALLKEDFGIELDIPVDRLIPTLPLRINYLLWIEDLLKLFCPGVPPNDFLGIDVGAGASCIYAILGSKFFGWNFLSLEVDDVSLTFAQANLTANDLQSRVRLSRVSPDEPFHEVLARCLGPDDAVRVPFVVCNPPFFADDAELREGTTRKDERPQPWSVSSASSVESVTIGGEVGFVRRIIESSLLIRDRIAVYTTMLGKQSSISPLKIFLKSHLISQIGTYEFCQGRTMRWGLCWIVPPLENASSSGSSFTTQTSLTPPSISTSSAASLSSSISFPISPFRAERKNAKPFKFIVPKKTESEYKLALVAWRLKTLLDEIHVENQEVPSVKGNVVHVRIKSFEKTWINQRRKRREKLREMKRMALKRTAEDYDGESEMAMDTVEPEDGTSLKTEGATSTTHTSQVKRLKMEDEDEGFVAEDEVEQGGTKESPRSSDGDSLSPTSVVPSTHYGSKQDHSAAARLRAPTLGNAETPSPNIDGGILEDGCGFEEMEENDTGCVAAPLRVPIVETTVSITKSSHHAIELELVWEPGQDRDVLYELLQFLRNRFQ